ncbi:PAS domain-containing sensor histidine kinase [Bacteroides helcogenes]|uniref:histidine kinase n=1 Tax=Bacteroides helcogenes (strain ATCC 35417 / DSM 20613 / JCM 6297 / CCUG 15421 / P 36-108) TaxID=693979 RepID=E6SQN7_BACT6|nr:ATP-binding protein [Bacteroides helcogenes]ADV43011.1 integral membrane sensor signal transduction histidine kinase [Bacteroides helcogenes P 36-108]MDY5236945.1 ATP-binding protein [Bacteroides helcogenes]
MIFSRRIYWVILLHITLILTTSGTGLWLIISLRGIIIGTLLIICSLFQIGRLVTYLNSFNRKLRLFFDAIDDSDNTLNYPEQEMGREEQLLNHSLNRINALLTQTKIDYQKQDFFYRSLLEKVPNGIVAYDSSKKIIFVNTAALNLLSCETVSMYSELATILQKENNKKRLSVSQSYMKIQNETITLLSIQDIDDKLNEKESESWNKLSHVLTHEIMNTIAPIISLSQTVASYPEINEKGIRGLRIIQAQSERLMEFTESFRHLSYLPQPEKHIFSLSNLLLNLQELLLTDFQENHITFTLQCIPETITINGDEKQLSQVILNLLKNAMQALAGNSHGEILLHAEQRAHTLIDITDNGTGIPPEIQEKVFIPFFTTKSEGTGIGLSLCKEIIRRHEGHLFISESRKGKTVFRIEMP